MIQPAPYRIAVQETLASNQEHQRPSGLIVQREVDDAACEIKRGVVTAVGAHVAEHGFEVEPGYVLHYHHGCEVDGMVFVDIHGDNVVGWESS